ncbi:helix-turn-helix DNA binding domain protein [Gordonia phage Camerico]|nr:helix-turn-helix DNA binding domain protein [Gordonia phage Camerico]
MSTDEEKRARAEELTKDLPDLLTREEVQEFFRASRQTVENWIRDPEYFPGAFKLGRKWLIPRGDMVNLAIKMYGEREEENNG